MKLKKLLIVLGSILSFILIVFMAFVCYFGNYYHSTTDEYYFTSTKEVRIVETDDYFIFSPAETANIGIIFYPGAKVEYTAYAQMMYKLVMSGYLCVLVDMPLNFAIFGSDMADDIMLDIASMSLHDINDWYIMGHSLGGAIAASYASSNKDKLTGVILLAGYSTSDLVGLEVLSIYGSNDKVLNVDKYNEYKNNLGNDYIEYIIDGGNHACFGNYGEQKGDGKSTIEKDEQINLTVNKIIEFIG